MFPSVTSSLEKSACAAIDHACDSGQARPRLVDHDWWNAGVFRERILILTCDKTNIQSDVSHSLALSVSAVILLQALHLSVQST